MKKILKAARENRNIAYRGIKIRMIYFSLETIEARRQKSNILKIQKF